MDYKLLLDMAVFAGDILMQNGAETYRVEDTVYRILLPFLRRCRYLNYSAPALRRGCRQK